MAQQSGVHAGAQPVVEQLVLEGPPDGQRLVPRLDAGTGRAAREGPGDLADGAHVHGVRARHGPVRGVRREPHLAGEGPYLLDEGGRRAGLPGTHQPRDAEQRGLLRRAHLVAPAVEQRPEPGEALVQVGALAAELHAVRGEIQTGVRRSHNPAPCTAPRARPKRFRGVWVKRISGDLS
ncbi:hypothetical protein ABT224_19445 [Streptomyces sp. NPDC001584]|uniref:hypothetical protein n=1 Tax=Streptomyces sp. NPDC001584 TaxID=3154521 RepID=UPI003323B1CB